MLWRLYVENKAATPEPMPVRGPGGVEITPLVIKDMQARDTMGRSKYGGPLVTNDGRDSLNDLYQEILDAAVYCKKLELELNEERKSRQMAIERIEIMRRENRALKSEINELRMKLEHGKG
jgi:hypothetical protein